MSEMVERVAEAIADSLNGANPDWANICARAAIEAMREPTEAMCALLRDKENGIQAKA